MNFLFLRRLTIFSLLFTIPSFAYATTLNVPSATYPTIQSGVDAAHDGDTVLVADGTYTGNGNRDIDFGGKNIIVTSAHGAATCTIDCQNNHFGFTFQQSETAAAKVVGFTIEHGLGIRISPKYVYQTGVGGTYVPSNPTVTACTFRENLASDGSGIVAYLGCSPTINACTFTNNTSFNGGAIELVYSNASITNCTFTGNKGYFGGAIFTEGHGTPTITDCEFSGNSATTDGTTMSFTDDSSAPIGGGIAAAASSPTITNCTFTRNSANLNNIQPGFSIYENTTPVGGGLVILNGSNPKIINCIFFGDPQAEVLEDFQLGYDPNSIISKYNDIQGGYPGTGNIDKDPLFVNASAGDFHLQPGSPCLGAGTPNGAPSTDLDGTPRPNPPSMGAYDAGAVPASITGFTLTPTQINAPGPLVAANVSVTGSFTKVTVSPAPGSLSSASPIFNLVTNSGGGWGGSFPTTFLKLAKTNPVTFIATGIRADGSTVTAKATLQIGALPTLAFSLSPDQTAIHRNQTFNLRGFVSDLTTVPAPNASVQITLPVGINYVSSNGFVYDDAARTLTLPVPTLAAGTGFYPIAVMLQVNASAPKYTSLVMAASVSCPGFQQVTQNPAVSVEAGQIPLGVEVDATGGFGILDGIADADLSQGNSPLHATLTPITSINSLLPIFGSTHRASIWLEAFVSSNGGATFTPGGSEAAYFLAQNGLISPSVSPTYNATFQSITDSVSVSASFTPRSASLTLIDTMITGIAAQTLKPIPSVDTIFSIWNEISQLSAFVTATNAFTKNPPKNKLQLLQDTALASKALLTISGPEKATIISVLKKYKLIDDYGVGTFDAFQKLIARAFGADNLLHIAADAFTIDGATLGDPMVITFKASSLSTQKSRSIKEKNSVSKVLAPN